MGRVSNNIDGIYLSICKDLLYAPKVGNTRELNDVKLVLKDISKNIVSVRNISIPYLFGELLWYFNGRNDIDFITKFSTFWNRCTDDGVTANSAYGHLMRNAFGFDQIEKVIELLKKDPDSRRAKINLNTPRENVIETHDEPCTMFLHFMIRAGKLHCTAVMRSNDIWYGFPYDVAFFTELQKYIADRLEVGYGSYTHFVCSLHLYDKDYESISKIVKMWGSNSKPIDFNREMFHEYSYAIAEAIVNPQAYWKGKDPKKHLIALLNFYGIYGGNK